MKISILLFLIGSILSSIDYEYYHFYDINFNERYYVDMKKYSYGFLPQGHNYYFRIAVYPNDKMEIECTVERFASIAFNVDVCPFNHKPSDIEAYTENNLCAFKLAGAKSQYNQYDRYTYPFTTGDNVNYISVRLENLQSLYYLDVYVYSETGMTGGIIALIIILPCLIIVGVVVAVLRFCCGCNICMGGSVRVNMI